MTEIHFQVDDLEPRRQLKRLGLFFQDLRTFWPLVVPLFIGWMRSQFESEGAYAGTPWAELSSRYGIWKQIHFPGKPILQLKGEMRRAASQPERAVTPRTLTLTIHDPKIAYHQLGTTIMPARPLVFDRLPAAAQRELEDAGRQYVETLLARL